MSDSQVCAFCRCLCLAFMTASGPRSNSLLFSSRCLHKQNYVLHGVRVRSGHGTVCLSVSLSLYLLLPLLLSLPSSFFLVSSSAISFRQLCFDTATEKAASRRAMAMLAQERVVEYLAGAFRAAQAHREGKQTALAAALLELMELTQGATRGPCLHHQVSPQLARHVVFAATK